MEDAATAACTFNHSLVRTATPDAALTVHLSQIQINVPVDDSKFAKPATAPAPTPTPSAKQ